MDGSFILANASTGSRIPREQLAEAAEVKRTVREYLHELEQENPVEEPAHEQERVSTTDPDATYASKGGPAKLGYYDNYLVDNRSCVIVGVQATAARLSQESVAARDMLTRFAARTGSMPQTLAADATYGNGEMLHWLEEQNITPYMRTRESSASKDDRLYSIDRFTHDPETNHYICPEGKQLTYVGINARNRMHVWVSTPKRCRDCQRKDRCTTGDRRWLAVHVHEAARQRARDLANTPAFVRSQHQRRKAEALFAELKNQIGLRRLRLRRMRFVREQFFLAATAQNLKRLVRFLHTNESNAVPTPA